MCLPLYRRLTALMLAVLLCTLSVAASAAGYADLATISQRDERFATWESRYRGSTYRSSGCGPSSISNAFIISLGVTNPDTAKLVTEEVLNLLCYPDKPIDTEIVPGRMINLNPGHEKWMSRFPTVKELLSAWNVSYIEKVISPDALALELEAPLTAPRLMIGRFSDDYRWQYLYEMSVMLRDAGHEDAIITLAHLSAGNLMSSGAFRSGNAGHFVCLSVPVKEFLEEGAVYLVDSLPRAIDGETYGFEQFYPIAYDFHGKESSRGEMKAFIRACQAERVIPTTLRITPKDDALAAITAARESGDQQAVIDAYTAYLKTTGLRGVSQGFIAIPAP